MTVFHQHNRFGVKLIILDIMFVSFVIDVIASLSFLSHFDGIIKGVIDLRDLIYLLSAMLVFLFANVVVIDMKKGG